MIGALAAESLYDVQVRRRPDAREAHETLTRGRDSGAESTSARSGTTALPLRLVDSGGVGIPVEGEWGADYSHDLRVFRQLILKEPPYVDDRAFRLVERQWRGYVERMLEYGNNAVDDAAAARADRLQSCVGADGVTRWHVCVRRRKCVRARHAAVRRQFAPMLDWTHGAACRCFSSTDMLALTPPCLAICAVSRPSATAPGIDASDPAVWEVYRAGLEELFDEVPSIAGLVIRFGEAGPLYEPMAADYRSAMAIRDARSLRAMLRGLLPLFESRHKTLVLRSWTVGVGPLGHLHTDPRVYEAVLGDIDSPALVISTKFTAGDFFSHLPLNPTLFGGRHRRIVELQAKPEFEGFGAFPNFLGEEHARALRVLTSANTRIVGTYLWSQLGGPARTGRRIALPATRILVVDRCQCVCRLSPGVRSLRGRRPARQTMGH